MPIYVRENHSRTFDKTDPADADRMGFGAQEIRDLKEDIVERLELEHMWDSSQEVTTGDGDGYHKKVSMKAITTPAAIATSGAVYVKTDTGDELHYQDDSVNEIQITKDGYLDLSSRKSHYISATMSVDHDVTGGLATIQFDTEQEDANGEYNPATYKMTAGEDGFYLLSALIYIEEGVDLYIYKNGVSFISIPESSGMATYGEPMRIANLSTILNLTETDYIEIKGNGGIIYASNSILKFKGM